MWLALALLFSAVGTRPAFADYTAKTHPSTQYQTLEGWGTSLCWFANVLGGAPDSVRNHYADLIFDPTLGLGLNVARYNIGGGENPAYNFMQFRARVPGYEPSSGVYDWTQDANQRWFLQAAMARGADQLEAFSNSPPYWMTNSGSVTGSTNGTSDNLNPNDVGAFTDYLATVVKHFHDTWGVTFRDVEPLNEPIAPWWKFGGSQEGCHFERSTQDTTINSLGAALAQNGSLTAVTAPDESFIDDALWSFMSYDSTAISYLYKVNTHSYGGSRRTQLGAVTGSSGKATWLSEHGDGDGTGMTLSENILADFHSLHPNAWVYWQAVDDSSAGGWGMLASNLNAPTDYSYTVNEKYYVMANYSRFIRPGYRFLLIDDGQSLAAYNGATRTLVLVTTNNNNSDTTVTYDLTEFNAVAGPAVPYRTSPSENLAQLGSVPISKKRFSAVAKANSVTTYVISGVTYTPSVAAHINDNTQGSGLDQFDYSGAWLYYNKQPGAYKGDNHWSGTPGDAYTIQFSGTQILLYASVGTDHGIAAFSIDGGPENEVDLYAAKRADDVLIYASPTLPSGVHTLKARVTGRQNPAATWDLIPADRADVVTGQPVLGAGVYHLINRNSGELLDISGSSQAAGAEAIQWPDYGGASQQWKLVAVGNGYYNLVNVNSGLALDVPGSVTTAGTYLLQAKHSTSTSQQWQLVPVTGPYYKLVNRNSGLNADVSGASTADGTGVLQWYDNGGRNQNWIITRVR
jgi:O-glycosyl hydrolase